LIRTADIGVDSQCGYRLGFTVLTKVGIQNAEIGVDSQCGYRLGFTMLI